MFVKTLLKHYSNFHRIRKKRSRYKKEFFFPLHRKQNYSKKLRCYQKQAEKKQKSRRNSKAVVPGRLLGFVPRQRNEFKQFNCPLERRLFQHSPEVNLAFTM